MYLRGLAIAAVLPVPQPAAAVFDQRTLAPADLGHSLRIGTMIIQAIPHEPTRWIVHSETRPEVAYIVDCDYYTGRADGCLWACG